MTCPRSKLSGDAIFSRAGSVVIAVVQTAWPSATASLRTDPSGAAAYTKRRSGSATGVELVMRYDPAIASYPLGVNRQRMAPSLASIARVFPYDVVTKKTSRVAPFA